VVLLWSALLPPAIHYDPRDRARGRRVDPGGKHKPPTTQGEQMDRYIVEHFNVLQYKIDPNALDCQQYFPITYLATDPHPEYRLAHYSENRIDDEHYIVQYIWEREFSLADIMLTEEQKKDIAQWFVEQLQKGNAELSKE
jgi:hypothetical protein